MSSSDRVEYAIRELVAALRDEIASDGRPRDDEPERLLSVDEAAELLGIGRTLAYGLIQGGSIRSVKVGRRRLLPASAVRAYARGVGRDD